VPICIGVSANGLPAGRFATRCVPSAACVAGPTMPSAVSPCAAWNFFTAAAVPGPKTPSTARS